METLKSQLSLRPLDASGRPSGTGRPSRTSREREGELQSFESELRQREALVRREEAPEPEAASQPPQEPTPAGEELEAREGATLPPGQAHGNQPGHEQAPVAAGTPAAATKKTPSKPEVLPAEPTLMAEVSGESPLPTAPPVASLLGANLVERVSSQGASKEIQIPINGYSEVYQDPQSPTGQSEEPWPAAEAGDLLQDGQKDLFHWSDRQRLESAGAKPEQPQAQPALLENRSEAPAPARQEPSATAPAQTEGPAPGSLQAERIERAERILDQVRLHLRSDLREAFLQLQPRELGRVAVHLSLREGRLRANLRVERAATLEVLEQHLPELRALLEQSGLNAESLELNLGFASGSERSPFETEQRTPPPPGLTRAEKAAVNTTNADQQRFARGIAQRMGIDTYA